MSDYDQQQPPPLFQMPSLTTLMGPQGPQLSAQFWDASFGQQADPFATEPALKGIAPNSTWPSPTAVSGFELSEAQRVPPGWNGNALEAADPPRSPSLNFSTGQKRKSIPSRADLAPPPAARTLAPSANASSDLSKKSDWAHQVIQELPDFYHVLSPSGYFLFASESIKELAGYGPEELIGRSITEMLHPDDVEPFVATFNQAIASKTQLSIYARFRKSDGRHLVIEFTGHARYGDAAPDASTLSSLTGISTTSPTIAKCFFAMGRLYPAKNTALLDSYLEHKIENERLKSRAKELYTELGDDVLSAGNYYKQGIDPPFMGSSSAGMDGSTSFDYDYSRYSSIPNSRPFGMSRTSPLKLGPGDDKKKHKSRRGNNEHDYVCHECGTDDSPEWRKGPNGPKTLCNACGLRYAKKSKAPKSATSKR